jgi:DNA-binding winged helix-turn-helix (wHTH) protein/Tol biopolymer transport system component
MPNEINHLYRFAEFEIDPANRRLSAAGEPLAIHSRAFDLLLYMVRNPNRLLTREELMTAVWSDAAVEEANLTQNVFVLRKALAARQAVESKLIDTVPGRGYRFTAAVEIVDPAPPEPVAVAAAIPKRVIPWRWFIAGAVTVALAILVLAARTGQREQKPVPLPRPLSTNAEDTPVLATALSPDGRYLAYAEAKSIVIQTLNTSDTRTIPVGPDVFLQRVSWYPDGTRLLISETVNDRPRIMAFPILSGNVHLLRDNAMLQAISLDGDLILYDEGSVHELWTMNGNGENAHRILTSPAPDKFYPMFWSPGSARAWFVRVHADNDKQIITLESCDRNGANPTVVLSDDRATGFRLLPPGRLIYARYDDARNFTDLWELQVNAAEGRAEGSPRRLTNWTNFRINGMSATADGKQLAFVNGGLQADVYVGDLTGGGKELTGVRRLTTSQRDDFPFFWTPDDTSLVFQSNRNGRNQIFRQGVGDPHPELLGMDSGEQLNPSFGGPWIYFRSMALGEENSWTKPATIRRMPASGGASVEVLRGPGIEVDCATAQPDVCIVARLEQKKLSFYRFDHQTGQGNEIAGMDFDSKLIPQFALSPQGSEIAVVDPKEQANRIRRISMTAGHDSEVEVTGRKGIESLFWAPDGKGWFAASLTPSNGEYLLRVDERGGSFVLFEEKTDGRITWGVPSHDGKKLAFLQWTSAANVWLIDNF